MNVKVRRNEKAKRYELVDDDNVIGVAAYRPEGDDTLVFPHTEIAPALQGRGLGERLVRGALDDVRRRSAKVRPACWFVADFMRHNPDYADLLAD
jgi:predicted GNAT family acetyltransferase